MITKKEYNDTINEYKTYIRDTIHDMNLTENDDIREDYKNNIRKYRIGWSKTDKLIRIIKIYELITMIALNWEIYDGGY